MTLAIGSVLHNRYRIDHLVGQGGFGAVYGAWDMSLSQLVALKENIDSGPESQRQFEREAKLLASLRHPGLPRVIDHFILPGQGQYLVMDYVEGQSMAQLLHERGRPLEEEEARIWTHQVCEALNYLHTRTPPIIHRDIKPANIIIASDGRAVLVDFGISKVLEANNSTTKGARALTPGYSPPEQYGWGRTDARSDIYALGATLYTLLTGMTPPEAPNLTSGLEVLTPPRQANPAVSEAAERAIIAAMEPNISQRLASVAIFDQMIDGLVLTPPQPIGQLPSTQLAPPAKTVEQVYPIDSSPPHLLSQQKSKAGSLRQRGLVAGVLLVLIGLILLTIRFIEPPVTSNKDQTPVVQETGVEVTAVTAAELTVPIAPVATMGSQENVIVQTVTVETVANTTSVAETIVPAGTAAAASFQEPVNATVRIATEGSFVDPELGMQHNSAGSGSGFIIDPSGIAVTTNQVVTGAVTLKVYVQGKEEPLNAYVLGVSECSDLAVIDIEGDGYPYLEWNNTPVSLNTEVYAVGYPLGDPEPTLTRGVISKEDAGGETSWASVDSVLEHNATINPGDAGGPLVTTDGKVVGVNYAGASDDNQYFAIRTSDALTIIEKLRTGIDVDSIGVNGEAVSAEDNLTGIWVASVKAGSPADQAGIKAGDIITRLGGLALASDGTMADYCDILRSRNATDIMSIEVLRYATSEVLEGRLNGDPLVQSFSFAQEVAAPEGGEATGAATYETYVGIYDDSQAIYVEVPAEWAEVDGSNWVDDEAGTVLGSELLAAPNLNEFSTTYTTPGVQILAGTSLSSMTTGELVDFFDFSADCTLDGRFDYTDPVYTGVYDQYSNCAGAGSVIIVLGAQPAAKNYSVIVLVQAVIEADLDALDHILNTFNVVGTLPG